MSTGQKFAHIRYTDARMRIRTSYDASFVNALKASVVERKWDADNKEWVVDIREYKTAMRVVKQFFKQIYEENKPPEKRKQRKAFGSSQKTTSIPASGAPDYAVLHLLPSAPRELVQSAYRTLAKLYHPDTSHLPDAEERMKTLNRAYQSIVKRHEYQNNNIGRT